MTARNVEKYPGFILIDVTGTIVLKQQFPTGWTSPIQLIMEFVVPNNTRAVGEVNGPRDRETSIRPHSNCTLRKDRGELVYFCTYVASPPSKTVASNPWVFAVPAGTKSFTVNAKVTAQAPESNLANNFATLTVPIR